MKTITLALPFDELAAVIARQLAQPGSPARPMPVDYIALGLARWAELEIRALVATAPAILSPRNAAGRRLLAALAAADRLAESEPPLRDLRARRHAARQLAARFGRKPEDWMLLDIWHGQIGCNVCQVEGPRAKCWGAAGCHGYANGCGCADCTAHYRIMEFRRATTGRAIDEGGDLK